MNDSIFILNILNELIQLKRLRNEKDKEKIENLEKQIEKEVKRIHRLHTKAKNYPPDFGGNIFLVNGNYGWKPRGWLESAYPGIGRGAILPTDWVGLGCTLLNEKALSLATFDGYGPDFSGTQDLFLVSKRWRPNDLKMSVITHVLCDHVKYELNEDKTRTEKIKHYQAYHEPEGLQEGHLRVDTKPWSPI